MSNQITFGSSNLFEITISWVDDGSLLSSRPKGYGFSLGTLKLVVGSYTLTAHNEADGHRDHVSWYLLPVFGWIAKHWAHLFHEEDFPWPERTAAAAATACNVALDRFFPEDNSDRFAVYDQVRRWWERHALRAGAAGGLLPDLFLRRLGDGIELSWSAREAEFAPEGHSFALAAGAAILAVRDVAEPLWRAMNWIRTNSPAPDEYSCDALKTLSESLDALGSTSDQQVRSIYLGEQLAKRVESVFRERGREELLVSSFDADVPVIDRLSAPVGMFGGVDPQLTLRDVRSLSGILLNQLRFVDTKQLDPYVDRTVGFPLSPAHDEGYNLAEDLLETLDLEPAPFVDVEAILARLGITLLERSLETMKIRGVALAGEGLVPTVVVNRTSPYSQNDAGRRFTMAHELCHILYDQSRAQRVMQVSGPWAPAGVEKRANAFAAMLLMPRALIEQHARRFNSWKHDQLSEIARFMRVSVGALTEHLYNLGYVDEAQREVLRMNALSAFQNKLAL